MKEIPLTQGKVALVDEEDMPMLLLHSWHASAGPHCQFYYARATVGVRPHQTALMMHRYILGAKPGEIVDHINRDSLDNTKSNLRICTNSQNHANIIRNRDNTTGYKGVYLSLRGYWVARIQKESKRVWLGYYSSPQEAAMVYDLAAISLFGEFALTNKMLGLL